MPYPSKTILAFPSQTVNPAGSPYLSSKIIIVENYTAAIIRLTTGALTGTTSPTLNCYIQQGMRVPVASDTALQDVQGLDANIVWNDFGSLTQVVASSANIWASVVGGGSVVGAAKDGTLTAGFANGPLGSLWRVKIVVGGTNVSWATVQVVIQLIP